MLDIQKRFMLFLLGCMFARALIVLAAKYIDKQYLPYMGIVATIVAVSWIYLFMFDLRKTGPEVMGQEIWWQKIRPIHALFYLIFAYMAFKQSDKAWVPLLVDQLFGLSAFLFFHYSAGDFNKLF